MNKFDLHIHSCYSNNLYGTKLLSPPSRSYPEDIIKRALSVGINIIAVTDHDNIIGSLRTIELAKRKYKNKILVIPGVEISSKDGHILAYNIYEDIPKNLSAIKTIKLIKEKGGVAVAAHPFNMKFSLKEKLIIELKDEIFALEISNSHSLKNNFSSKFIKENNSAFTIGSDAHSLEEIGLCYGKIRYKINTIEEFLSYIKEKKVDLVHNYDKKILRRVVPAAIKSFFYWKKKQLQYIFNKNIFLPYNDYEINKL